MSWPASIPCCNSGQSLNSRGIGKLFFFPNIKYLRAVLLATDYCPGGLEGPGAPQAVAAWVLAWQGAGNGLLRYLCLQLPAPNCTSDAIL